MTLLESSLNFIEKLCREAVTAELAEPKLTNPKKVAEHVKSLEYKLWVQKMKIFEYAFVQAENMLANARDSFTLEEKGMIRDRLIQLAAQYPGNAFVGMNMAVLLQSF